MWDQILVSVVLIAGWLLLYEIALPRGRETMAMTIFESPRLAWFNDWLNQTFVIVVTAAAVTTYFIVARGWAW
jgi:hypothetical protein